MLAHEREYSTVMTPPDRSYSADVVRAGAPRSDAEAALLLRFDAATAGPSSAASDALRAAATAFGHEVKASGRRPEQLVLLLKELLYRHAGLAGRPSLNEDGDQHTWTARPVYRQVLGWSLDAYFAEAASA